MLTNIFWTRNHLNDNINTHKNVHINLFILKSESQTIFFQKSLGLTKIWARKNLVQTKLGCCHCHFVSIVVVVVGTRKYWERVKKNGLFSDIDEKGGWVS